MRYGEGDSVPIPTKEEIDYAAMNSLEVVAVSAVQIGPLNYMKFAFHNNDTSTVCVGPVGGYHLLEALKALFPDHAKRPASPVRERRTEEGYLVIQSGHMSG
jgi:hypothetical protein